MKLPIYLDYASTTPVDPRVATKMQKCLSLDGNFGNPASRSHGYGWKAEEAVEEARSHIAKLVNCDQREIVWTSGATESDNLAIKGAARFYKERGNHIITSKIEHKAVLDSCRQLEREGFEVSYLTPNNKGMILPEEVFKTITDQTILVSLMHVNNEIGVINDIQSIGKITRACQIIALFSSEDFNRYIVKIYLSSKEGDVLNRFRLYELEDFRNGLKQYFWDYLFSSISDTISVIQETDKGFKKIARLYTRI